MCQMPPKDRDYYKILGVTRTATPEQIEGAFRNLARRWHPDVCPDIQKAAENFKLIAEAYDVLGAPEKRRAYDRLRARDSCRRPSSSRSTSVARPPRHQWRGRRGSHRRPSDLDDFIQSMFLGVDVRPEAPASENRRLDVETELPVAPEEARRGGTIQFFLSFRQPCTACQGEGERGGVMCETCGGSGTVRGGRRPVTVDIPPGVWTGTLIRVPREGKAAPDGGVRGDLYLRIRVRPSW